MRIFIEVTESGEWDEELQDYVFTEADAPTFFAVDQIQWFQQTEDYVIIGIIGYETVFKTETEAFIKARQNGIFGCICLPDEE